MNLPDDLERPFNEPWEAQAFAMAVKLNERGVFAWSEWAGMLGKEIRENPALSYYECWLAALEKLMEAKSVIGSKERQDRIDAWDRAAKATPHGQPIELNRGFAGPEMSQAAKARKSDGHP